jgi:hypothetical protein
LALTAGALVVYPLYLLIQTGVVVGQGVQLYELRARRKSLEEWFVDVMGDDQRPG